MIKRGDGRLCLKKTINGKKRYFYGADELECFEKYKRALNEAKYADPSRTFGEFADAWAAAHSGEVSLTTWQKSYAPTLDKLQDLYPLKITEVTAPVCQSLLNKYAKLQLSKKTLCRLRSCISQIFDFAIISGAEIINFTPSLKIARTAPETQREALTVDEMRTVLQSGELFPTFLLLTGLRRGEITALQWKHVDLQARVIHVEQSAEFLGNNPVVKSTKTKAGRRVIPIPQFLAEMLTPAAPEDYVFGGEKMWTQQRNRYQWTAFCKRHDLQITQHQLRHSYASILAWSENVGVKDIQAALGHADSRTSMQIYAHAQDALHAAPAITAALDVFAAGK